MTLVTIRWLSVASTVMTFPLPLETHSSLSCSDTIYSSFLSVSLGTSQSLLLPHSSLHGYWMLAFLKGLPSLMLNSLPACFYPWWLQFFHAWHGFQISLSNPKLFPCIQMPPRHLHVAISSQLVQDQTQSSPPCLPPLCIWLLSSVPYASERFNWPSGWTCQKLRNLSHPLPNIVCDQTWSILPTKFPLTSSIRAFALSCFFCLTPQSLYLVTSYSSFIWAQVLPPHRRAFPDPQPRSGSHKAPFLSIWTASRPVIILS